jgi:hypothetical protein
MLDFTTAGTIELAHAIQAERKEQRDSRKWHRVLRDLEREAGGFVATPRRRSCAASSFGAGRRPPPA